MTKLDVIRKMKSLFMKWRLHVIAEPFTGAMLNLIYMSKLGKWRKTTKVAGYNDWYQGNWDYNRREKLYEAIISQEQVGSLPIDYFEFGVCGGYSFQWWLEHNNNSDSKFYGFDTFTGLPEDFGVYKKGAFNKNNKPPEIADSRVKFYQGLFQQTVPGFLLELNNNRRNIIMLDADLFSSTLYALTSIAPFLKKGDIIFFDEFAVPTHEFKAFYDFVQCYYINMELVAAANNYYFAAFKIV